MSVCARRVSVARLAVFGDDCPSDLRPCAPSACGFPIVSVVPLRLASTAPSSGTCVRACVSGRACLTWAPCAQTKYTILKSMGTLHSKVAEMPDNEQPGKLNSSPPIAKRQAVKDGSSTLWHARPELHVGAAAD